MLFWATLFLFLLPLDVQQGKEEFFLFFFTASSLSPCMLLPKPKAPHPFIMRNQRGRALQTTPVGHLARSPVAVAGQEDPAPHTQRQGHPRSPLPYKYCSQHQHKRGTKKETRGKEKESKRGGRERERERERRRVWHRGGFKIEINRRAGSTKRDTT